ncbi:selenocysteine-specific translation elongation factor [Kibdelosporangium lantanae]
MHVIATAGHVDHGKSTLIRALTGMEPDRWAEERRRGLTIDLGFAWTSDRALAFVDVPGHERFVPNTLAGIGPAPAVMLVVAADEGWQPQSTEHLAALDALGVDHGLLVITKTDRADPDRALAQARRELDGTTLADIPAVTVSAHTGRGLPELRDALDALAAGLPAPDTLADVRLWIDRSFSIRGAGTVVTGTLTGGTLSVGDELTLNGERVHVRGLQALGQAHQRVDAVARIAVNLRGTAHDTVRRGDTLLTPGGWRFTSEVDVQLHPPDRVPTRLVAHVGTAATPVHVRPLGKDYARLTLTTPLPLRVGDRGLLRDPGAHRIAAGFETLEVQPPPLGRRGAARARADQLASGPDHLSGRGFVLAADARAMGWPTHGKRLGDWLVHEDHWRALEARVRTDVTTWLDGHPLAAGMPVEILRQTLGLPTADLLPGDLPIRDGLVVRSTQSLPPPVETAVRAIEDRLRETPFSAPEANDLRDLGLGRRELAAAVRLGRLTAIADGVVLGPGAYEQALEVLSGLPQPFTVSDARRALNTSRRVAIPLLEHLDQAGHTRQTPDGRHLT